MNKPKKPYILKMSREEVQTKYQELGNIQAVAAYYGASSSTMGRFFRRLDIPYIQKHKQQFNEEFFSYDTPEAFYLAGFLAADGCISKKKYCINIDLSDKDRLFLEDVQKLIDHRGTIKTHKVYNSKRNNKWQDTINVNMTFSSKKTVYDLSRFNVVPAKTKIYDFPNWLLEHQFVNHYMRGYMDGDGHLGLRDGRKLRFDLAGNFSFLQKYRSILEKNCGIHHNNIHTRPNNLSMLSYTGNIIVPKICQFLYNNSTFHMERKYNIYASFIGRI